MVNESMRQLIQMEEKLDEYKGLTAAAAAKLYDWLDGDPITTNGQHWNNMSRREQANALLSWFDDMIDRERNGL